MSYKLQLHAIRSVFAGTIWMYFCALDQSANPGFKPVRSYQGSLPAHVGRCGTGTGFDFFEGNVCFSPQRRYSYTYVPFSACKGSLTQSTTRSVSVARTTGRLTCIGV